MGRRRYEAAGAIHHVFARGAKKHLIFHDDHDRRQYVRALGHVVVAHEWNLLAYCLMENHIHLVVETPQPNLGLGMYWLHGPYALEFNRRHGLHGHVFEAPYGAKRMKNDEQLATALYYVDQNPVKARLCERPEDWRWGSRWAFANGLVPGWLATERLAGHRDDGAGGADGPADPGTGASACWQE